MTFDYRGKPGNEGFCAELTISGATNATPIVVTTSAPHGLDAGDFVWIYQVQGNAAANGRYYVVPTSATQLQLYGGWTSGAGSSAVAGSGAYTTGGKLLPLAFNAGVQLLTDLVDDASALNFNTPFEGNFDREAWLAGRVGKYSLVNTFHSEISFGANPEDAWNSGTAPSGAWGDTTALLPIPPATTPVIDVGPNDWVELALTMPMANGAGHDIGVSLVSTLANYDGSSPVTSRGPHGLVEQGTVEQMFLHHRFQNLVGIGQQLTVAIETWGIGGTSTRTYYKGWQLYGKIWMVNR